MSDPASHGPLRRTATLLFEGWGYNQYRRENQLRADDLLIRSKSSELLGQSRARAQALEAAFRREHLPAPTRAQPFPDAAAVGAAQALQRAAQQIEALETTIRNAAVPEMDRIHQRHRNERATLERLVEADSAFVAAIVGLRDAVLALPDGAAATAELPRLLQVEQIRALWAQREQILAVLQ